MGTLYTVDSSGNIISSGGLKVATSGATPSFLNYFEDDFQHITNLTGSVATVGYVITITRINKLVFLNFPLLSLPNALSNQPITATVALPVRFRPFIDTFHVCEGARNAIGAVCIRVTTAGVITIFGDTSQNGFLNGQLLTVNTTNMILRL